MAVPEGKAGNVMLAYVGQLMRIGEQTGKATAAEIALGRRCDSEAILRDPTVVEPRLREAQERLEAMGSGKEGGLCADRAACIAKIHEHADAIASLTPDSSWPSIPPRPRPRRRGRAGGGGEGPGEGV